MADDWAIKVDGLGKEYRIAASRGGYTALRDVLAQRAGRLARRLVGRGAAAAPTHEPFWSLRDVSFEVPRGECVGVIGRNGAGKSTLLKILSRITEPTEGEIRLRGRVGSLLEVGTGFHPELTGRENVFLNGAILGMSRREIARKFGEIVSFAEVEKFLDTPVKYYSSGMYTRLAFAVAAHLEPEILIVDEVLAVGDAEFQKKCLGKMGEVAKGGRTVLFVSHNMSAVSNLCSEAVWLRAGEVHRLGSAPSLVAEYLSNRCHPSGREVDLDAVTRLGDTGQVIRLTRLEWLTGFPLLHGCPTRLRITAKARSRVEDVAVGVGLCLADGQRFLTFDSDQGGRARPASPGEELVWELDIPQLPLAPGVYPVDLGLRSGPMYAVDSLPGVTDAVVECTEGTAANIMQFENVGVRLAGGWAAGGPA